jgi:hypothetical protein
MTDEIQRALTGLDWANIREGHEKPLHGDMGVSLWGEGIALHTGNRYTEVAAPGDRHTLAALCLYQQPFGFTHEDVKMLEAFAAYSIREKHDTAAADHLTALASRIASLLPPQP